MILSIKKPVTILSMDEARAKYIAAIIEMFILVCLAGYLISKYLAKYYLEDVNKDFRKNRQNPGFAFASGALGKSPSEVFNGLVGQRITKIFKKFLSFLTPIFSIFTNIFKSFQNSINKLRTLLRPIRDFFKASAQKFYSAISKYVIGAVYSLNKMRNGMRRSLSGFNLIFHTLEHTKNSLMSLIDSPPIKIAVGFIEPLDWIADKGSKLFCFDGNTVLEREDLSRVYMKNINIGDVLSDGSKVIVKQVFYKREPLYLCKLVNTSYPIKVTGEHKVKHNNKWVCVKDCAGFERLFEYSDYLYCITTDTGIINIDGVLFKDYSESKNKYLNMTVNSLILSKLNSNIQDSSMYAEAVQELEHGFDGDTLIHSALGIKRIKDINIGDMLTDGVQVIGKIDLLPDHFTFYDYDTLKMSSNTKILENNIWKNIEKVDDSSVTSIKPSSCINLVTSNGYIPVFYEKIFLDYCETSDDFINEKIDEILEYA